MMDAFAAMRTAVGLIALVGAFAVAVVSYLSANPGYALFPTALVVFSYLIAAVWLYWRPPEDYDANQVLEPLFWRGVAAAGNIVTILVGVGVALLAASAILWGH
jgi:hypothetical protein